MHSVAYVMLSACVCLYVCVYQPGSLFLPEPQWWCRATSQLPVTAKGREQSFEVGSDFSPRYRIDQQQRYRAAENTA